MRSVFTDIAGVPNTSTTTFFWQLQGARKGRSFWRLGSVVCQGQFQIETQWTQPNRNCWWNWLVGSVDFAKNLITWRAHSDGASAANVSGGSPHSALLAARSGLLPIRFSCLVQHCQAQADEQLPSNRLRFRFFHKFFLCPFRSKSCLRMLCHGTSPEEMKEAYEAHFVRHDHLKRWCCFCFEKAGKQLRIVTPCCGGDLDPETDDGKLVVSVKCGEFVGDIPARAALQQDRLGPQ